MNDITTIEEYLARYGKLLAAQAEQSLRPLHVPGRDPLPPVALLRQPFDAQAHLIAAGAKALRRQKSLMIVGEMGTGKTLIGMSTCHAHAAGQPYRAIVMCPGQLVNKWEREIKETIPRVVVVQLPNWRTVVRLTRKPIRYPTWYILARDTAKLGAKWRPAFHRRNHEPFLRCPACFARLIKPAKGQEFENELSDGENMEVKDLAKRQLNCLECKSPLWTFTNELRKIEPAKYIHKHLRGFFTYLIADEQHEEKSATSAQANALGSLAASATKIIGLSGTLIGGYAEHLRPLLFRLAPTSLVQEGFTWKMVTAFSERYGRIETRISEKETSSDSNSQSRGKKSSTKLVRPGIMPTLFGRHLMSNAVFLGLDEVASNLPVLHEHVQGCEMDAEIAGAYEYVQKAMDAVIKEMVRKGDRRFLGAMLQTLLAYPDHPYGWGQIGYHDDKTDSFVPVVSPPNFSAGPLRPKEKAILEIVKNERDAGRQVWVYTVMTGEKDIADRLERIFKMAGLRTNVLRSSVELKKREEWIAKNGPKADVIISHPRLVETGLDLFDKGGKHNFPTLIFYSTGYNLFTLRQASRRSWRIGQRLPCKVHYLFYEETMQARAMTLMGKKMAAAQAIEGKFSSDGLVAMGGDDGIEMALAKSLADRLDEGSAARAWQRVGVRDALTKQDMPVEDFAAQMAALAADAGPLFRLTSS